MLIWVLKVGQTSVADKSVTHLHCFGCVFQLFLVFGHLGRQREQRLLLVRPVNGDKSVIEEKQ